MATTPFLTSLSNDLEGIEHKDVVKLAKALGLSCTPLKKDCDVIIHGNVVMAVASLKTILEMIPATIKPTMVARVVTNDASRVLSGASFTLPDMIRLNAELLVMR